MKLKIGLILLVIILLGNQRFSRRFPVFELQTCSGDTLTNEFFKGKMTIVCMGHIECIPAIILLKDLDSLARSVDTSQFQVLAILENTQQHIDLFYSDSIANHWRSMRTLFKIDTLGYPIIPECKTQNLTVTGSDTFIGNHCRILSKKVHTKDSPTLLLVDEYGRIISKNKGYIAFASVEERMNYLTTFLSKS